MQEQNNNRFTVDSLTYIGNIAHLYDYRYAFLFQHHPIQHRTKYLYSIIYN